MLRARRGLALALIGVSVLAGCAPRRSPEAFCRTLAAEKQRYLDKVAERGDKSADRVGKGDVPWLSLVLGTSFDAVDDATVMFHRLERTAPDDIRPDVKAVRQALERQREALKDLPDNPLGAAADSLASSLGTLDSWIRVSAYVSRHCTTRL